MSNATANRISCEIQLLWRYTFILWGDTLSGPVFGGAIMFTRALLVGINEYRTRDAASSE
jgi:hypothetical protein